MNIAEYSIIRFVRIKFNDLRKKKSSVVLFSCLLKISNEIGIFFFFFRIVSVIPDEYVKNKKTSFVCACLSGKNYTLGSSSRVLSPTTTRPGQWNKQIFIAISIRTEHIIRMLTGKFHVLAFIRTNNGGRKFLRELLNSYFTKKKKKEKKKKNDKP